MKKKRSNFNCFRIHWFIQFFQKMSTRESFFLPFYFTSRAWCVAFGFVSPLLFFFYQQPFDTHWLLLLFLKVRKKKWGTIYLNKRRIHIFKQLPPLPSSLLCIALIPSSFDSPLFICTFITSFGVFPNLPIKRPPI